MEEPHQIHPSIYTQVVYFLNVEGLFINVMIIILETSYMSPDLWEQLMAKEKERVKKLEEKYGDLMRSKSVSTCMHDALKVEIFVQINF